MNPPKQPSVEQNSHPPSTKVSGFSDGFLYLYYTAYHKIL